MINVVTDFNVDNTGLTYTQDSLRTAIETVQNETLFLPSGTYKLNITSNNQKLFQITSNLHILGEQGTKLILYQNEERQNLVEYAYFVFYVNLSDNNQTVRFDNFELFGPSINGTQTTVNNRTTVGIMHKGIGAIETTRLQIHDNFKYAYQVGNSVGNGEWIEQNSKIYSEFANVMLNISMSGNYLFQASNTRFNGCSLQHDSKPHHVYTNGVENIILNNTLHRNIISRPIVSDGYGYMICNSCTFESSCQERIESVHNGYTQFNNCFFFDNGIDVEGDTDINNCYFDNSRIAKGQKTTPRTTKITNCKFTNDSIVKPPYGTSDDIVEINNCIFDDSYVDSGNYEDGLTIINNSRFKSTNDNFAVMSRRANERYELNNNVFDDYNLAVLYNSGNDYVFSGSQNTFNNTVQTNTNKQRLNIKKDTTQIAIDVSLALSSNYDTYFVSGVGDIESFVLSNAFVYSKIRLIFEDIVTLKNGIGNIIIGYDYVTQPNESLQFILKEDENWYLL